MSSRVSSARPLALTQSQRPLEIHQRSSDPVVLALLRDQRDPKMDRVVGASERSVALKAIHTVAGVTDFGKFVQDPRVKSLTKEHAGKYGFRVNTKLLLTFVWSDQGATQLSFAKLLG